MMTSAAIWRIRRWRRRQKPGPPGPGFPATGRGGNRPGGRLRRAGPRRLPGCRRVEWRAPPPRRVRPRRRPVWGRPSRRRAIPATARPRRPIWRRDAAGAWRGCFRYDYGKGGLYAAPVDFHTQPGEGVGGHGRRRCNFNLQDGRPAGQTRQNVGAPARVEGFGDGVQPDLFPEQPGQCVVDDAFVAAVVVGCYNHKRMAQRVAARPIIRWPDNIREPGGRV